MKWIIRRQIQHSPPLQQGASGPISGQTGLSGLTTSGFCFLVQIRAFAIKTSPGLPHLNIKEKTKWILVVVEVAKWRHRPNGLFDKLTELRHEICLLSEKKPILLLYIKNRHIIVPTCLLELLRIFCWFSSWGSWSENFCWVKESTDKH